MEIANRVIEFKKRKNRHITVVLICNFHCLAWTPFRRKK